MVAWKVVSVPRGLHVVVAGLSIALMHLGLLSPTAYSEVSIEFHTEPGPGGTTYNWQWRDDFDPANPVVNVDLRDPGGNSFSIGVDNYNDFRISVEGEWSLNVEFDDGSMESVQFNMSGLPLDDPFLTPVILSPLMNATIMSGEAFFPDLVATTVTTTGFLSRTRFNFNEGVGEFVTGGSYNGFRATLDPGIAQADFRFLYSNVENDFGLISDVTGDDTLISDNVSFWGGSETRTVLIVAVPEPASFMTLVAFGLVSRIRRRRR